MKSRLRQFGRFCLKLTLAVLLFLIAAGAGTLGYFHYAPPSKSCLSCHEMGQAHDGWASSAHATVHCRSCHGGSLTLDVHAVKEHVNRLVGHFGQVRPENIRLSHEQALEVHDRCRSCHEAEFAKWQGGGHRAGFARIFLDARQNQREQLNGDCLRCHGMFADGPTQTVVTPLNTTGPWKLLDPALADKPTILCLSCHAVHVPRERGAVQHYARREKTHIPAQVLPVPAMRDNARALAVSADPRQRLCVQCHAPRSFHAAGTSDDRTPRGVHAGLSCMSCHDAHSNSASAAACTTCHPALSNCGQDVLTMDTTFKSPASRHNIHSVSCPDCHPSGVPTRAK